MSDDHVKLTEKGAEIGEERRKFLLKNEPVLEVIAGIADGLLPAS